ncbi:glycosyltransferase family 39 protein, partial [Patescibacteria group bacterium]|nr:glycosyltransferase family 39 protein [Patescibacteria group bacterium]
EKIALKIKNWIRENPREAILLAVILLVGSFLRLYKIADYMTFLGDEGRDVTIVRRLLVEGHPPLIGPGTSIGNMYLGPLYYYMMAPALLIAGFSPIGPAVQIAVLGVITIFFVWFVAREWFGKYAAFIAASLYAIAPAIIVFSRSSWNPNIMPFFALLCIYSLWEIWQKHKWGWLIVLGISFAFVLQSHYLGLLLLPTLGLFWFLTFRDLRSQKIENWKLKIGNFAKYSFFSMGIFAILMSPLVIFDARHGWINFNAMKKFFTARQETVSARPWNAIPNFWPTFEKAMTRLVAGTDITAGGWVALLLFLGLLFLLIKTRKHVYGLLSVWLGFAFLGLGLYKQTIYDHYYGFFFAAPFLLLGGIGEYLVARNKQILKLSVWAIFAVLVFINLLYNPFRYEPNRQLQRAEDVARKILQESGGQRFNLAVIAQQNYEDGYKYFLLSWKAPVVDIDAQHIDQTVTNQLFAVCELPKEKCNPINNPKAEIARFGWSKIENQWEVSGAIIFKLGHAK